MPPSPTEANENTPQSTTRNRPWGCSNGAYTFRTWCCEPGTCACYAAFSTARVCSRCAPLAFPRAGNRTCFGVHLAPGRSAHCSLCAEAQANAVQQTARHVKTNCARVVLHALARARAAQLRGGVARVRRASAGAHLSASPTRPRTHTRLQQVPCAGPGSLSLRTG
ncbi:hypothetical protein B0H10DRAFT_2119339 [Mycena sp. CBHHK59/15]|nr:hypothetical protein B0H10DRAFT_2119339 [Mycena sp. CBHHK59/15]